MKNTTTAPEDQSKSLDTNSELIARVEKIYRKFAPGLFKCRTKVGHIDALDLMITRYLRHRFDNYSDLADFTHAAVCSDLQPRERWHICCAIEDLLIEINLKSISRSELHDALYAPIWRVEDALRIDRAA